MLRVSLCFSPYLGILYGGGGGQIGLVHNLLMQLFTLDSSKIGVFETYFFDTMITQNDHPKYVKHVSGSIYMFFTQSPIKLLDQSQPGAYRGKHHIAPHIGPFWVYSRTRPQGVEWFV